MHHVHGYIVKFWPGNRCIVVRVVCVVRILTSYGFLDPSDVLRSIHLIPAFSPNERSRVFFISQSNAVKATSFETAFVIQIASEPMDLEEVHALGLHTLIARQQGCILEDPGNPRPAEVAKNGKSNARTLTRMNKGSAVACRRCTSLAEGHRQHRARWWG